MCFFSYWKDRNSELEIESVWFFIFVAFPFGYYGIWSPPLARPPLFEHLNPLGDNMRMLFLLTLSLLCFFCFVLLI